MSIQENTTPKISQQFASFVISPSVRCSLSSASTDIYQNSEPKIVPLKTTQQVLPSSVAEVEWAHITYDKILVATADRVWLHQSTLGESNHRFLEPIGCPGNIAITQKLLDGAIAAAKNAASASLKSPTFTPAQWVWQLVGAYHLTHSYPPLIKEAAQRFQQMGRQTLSQWAVQKAIEELGHDRLALRDIQSMGYNAEAVVEALVIPASAVALVNYLTQSVRATDPIGCVGYSYAMERIATGIKEKHIQSIEALLPPDIRATRCLRTHSSLGADVGHLEGTFQMIVRLTPQERACVAKTCYETALLYFQSSEEEFISEEELQHLLIPLKSRKAREEIYSLTP
jgi:hypothetical protein